MIEAISMKIIGIMVIGIWFLLGWLGVRVKRMKGVEWIMVGYGIGLVIMVYVSIISGHYSL